MNNSTIFVSIASYRDPELIPTVESLINNAQYPELLHIVIFEQNDIQDSYLDSQGKLGNIKILRTDYKNAKGPVWARAIIQQYYSGEDYYLQIDSHMRCIKHWDTILKDMLELLPQPAVLTQYPPEYETNSPLDPSKIRSGLYIQGFGLKDRFPRIQSDLVNYVSYYPYISKAWAACFSFSKGSIIKDAPYDQTLEYLFFGEELDITLKLFYKGYYFFSPHISVFYTKFNREYRRTFWEDIPKEVREPLEEKSRHILWKRILTQDTSEYMKFADILSFVDSKMHPNAKTFKRKTQRIILR